MIIGSARIDEHGNAAGGAAGDQTGREVCTEKFYMHPLGWYAYRLKDPNKAETLAAEMAAACKNNNIGYDQNQRTNIIAAITKAKTMSNITWKTECDCSSLVRACIMAVGLGDVGNFTTYTEGKVLAASGLFEERITVTANTVLYDGDVLVTKRKGHTCICVSGNPRTKSQSGTSLNKTPKWAGMVNTGLLNVRTWAGTENPNIKAYPHLAYGNMVDVCDTVKAKNGSDWYYVRIAGKYYGFVAAQYIS